MPWTHLVRFKFAILAQVIILSTPPLLAESIIEKYERAVVFLSGATEVGISFGSGLQVARGDERFLVTAEHVVSPMIRDQKVLFRSESGKTSSLDLQTLAADPDLNWIVNNKSDVAVLKIKGHPEFVASTLSISVSLLGTAPKERPLRMMGFPFGFGVEQEHFSPISKEVRQASGLLTLSVGEPKKRVTVFLLDDPSASGFSGGPVFLTPSYLAGGITTSDGREGRCVGIVSGVISDKTGGKFGTAIPASVILETVELAAEN